MSRLRYHLLDVFTSQPFAGGPMGWVVEQGVETGRPSERRVALDLDGTEASAVLVGSDAVVLGEGSIEVPGPAAARDR